MKTRNHNTRSSIFHVSTVVGMALLAGGCTVGPNYRPPEAHAPTQWGEPLAGGETNRAASVAAWWKTFHDPVLVSLVDDAVRANSTLRVAEARVREARALRSMKSADFWPTVHASGSYTRNRFDKHGYLPLPPNISLTGVPFDYNLYEAGFDAAWEIDVFGGTRRAVEAANAEVAAAEYSRRDVLVSLVAEVSRNYIEARGFQQRLAIVGRNVKAQREIVAIAADRHKAGLSSELDVRQSSMVLANTEAEIPRLETFRQQAIHRLSTLAAQPLDALAARMGDTGDIPAHPPEVPVDLPSQLLLRRPDVQRAERELAAATARIGVATADLFPKFSLTGVAGLESVSASDWFTAGSRFWTAGPTVQWRIFDAARIRANIRAQNARQEQALYSYRNTVAVAFEDVENALVSYAKEQTRRRTLDRAAMDARASLQIARDLYQNGLADFLRVLDAERSLYQAEDQLAQSDRTIALNLVALYKALGGGWDALAPSTNAPVARLAKEQK